MTRTPTLLVLSFSALALAGCGDGGDPLAADTSSDSPSSSSSDGSSDGGSADSGTVVVGSANFPENTLLAEIYAAALEVKGVTVQTKLNIGAREVYLKAMTPQDASVDIIPEYTGVLRDYFKGDQSGTTSKQVYKQLVDALPDYLTALKPSSAEDKDTVSVTKETADKYSLSSIADLKDVAGDLTLGGPPEWKTRQTGVPGLEAKYGVVFSDFRVLDAGGPLTLRALVNGQVDAGNLFSTDPNIAAEDLVPLDDPESLFAAQNVVPLVRSEAFTPKVKSTLNAVSAKLDTETLGQLVTEVVIDKKDPAQVAQQFLSDSGLG